MGDVVQIPVGHCGPIEPAKIVETATTEEFESVMVVGWTKDGNLYVGMSDASIPNALFLMEHVKQELMSDDDE